MKVENYSTLCRIDLGLPEIGSICLESRVNLKM